MIRAFRAHCQFRTSLAALDWLYVGADNPSTTFRSDAALLLVQPDHHPELEPLDPADPIGANQESIEVVVADGAVGAPAGEFAVRDDFGDAGVDPT